MVNREIIELKNEFLKELREIETKLDKKFEKQTIILDTIKKEQEEKINLTIQKNEQLYDSMISQKLKIEKITELSIDQKRLNDMLISHEMRINNLLTENKKLSSDYDKIITDNLMVPGYIGASCLYKNLSEYIQNNIKEIQSIKKEKQNNKKLAEDIKTKLDYFMKNMLNLVDNTVTRCKQYTDNKQVYLEKILNNKLVEFSEKNMELRTQIFSNLNKTNQQVQNFGQTIEYINNIKENVDNQIDMKFKEIQDLLDESKKSMENNMDEMVKFKNSIIEIINKRIDNMNKSQLKNNNIMYDMKYKKSDNFISPSIKSFRGINKREENLFSIKNNKNLNNNNNSNIFKKKPYYGNNAIDEKQNKDSKFSPNQEKMKIEEKEKKKKEKKEEKEEKVKRKINISIENYKNSDENLNKININNNSVLKESSNNNTEKDKKEEPTIDVTKKNINNEYILQKIEDENNNKQNDNNNNKLSNNDNNNNENINGNNASSTKNISSIYSNNIKSKRNEKITIQDIINNNTKNDDGNSNNNTINVKDNNKMKIPKIISNLNNRNNEKRRLNMLDYFSNKNLIKNYKHNQINTKKQIETRNNISKSINNTFNYHQNSKEKENEKEKELKTIKSDRLLFKKKRLFNTSPKFFSIETQTANINTRNKKKLKFPKIGFSYKIINLGYNINFRDNDSEKPQNKDGNSKMNIDLSSPLTNTYKIYQKKKNEKKNMHISSNDLPLNMYKQNHNNLLPNFNNTTSNNSFHKKKYYKSIDYEYNNNMKMKKNSDSNHSIESVKSYKIKILAKSHLK